MTDKIDYKGNVHPPFTNSVSTLSSLPKRIIVKKIITTIVGVIIVGFILVLISSFIGIRWIGIVSLVITALLLILLIYSNLNSKMSSCPYCSGVLGTGAFDDIAKNDENLKVECPHCFQWLISHQGQIKAFTHEDAKNHKKFDSPVFKESVWPDECIVCGSSATHWEDLKTTSRMIIPVPMLAYIKTTGTLSVPYCDDHKEAVNIKIKHDELRVFFPDLDMQRRYLAANSNTVKDLITKE